MALIEELSPTIYPIFTIAEHRISYGDVSATNANAATRKTAVFCHICLFLHNSAYKILKIMSHVGVMNKKWLLISFY